MSVSLIHGRIAALAAATSYGVVTSFSKIAYEGGANPPTVLVIRFLVGGLLLGLIIALTHRTWRWRVQPGIFLAVVLSWYLINIGHLGAVQFIPVSLAAIIFYTFPLLVAAYKRLVDRSAMAWYEILGFVLAFCGLCIALGPTLAESDWRGIGLAAMASIAAAFFLIVYEYSRHETDAVTGAFWLSIGAALIGAVVLLSLFDIELPTTQRGTAGVTALSIFGLAAFVLNLVAVKYAGAAVTAMILNFEPVVIFLMAALLVGEEITLTRFIGLGLVMIALLLSQWPVIQKQWSKPISVKDI